MLKTGLQISVGHWTMTDRNKMCDRLETILVGHHVREKNKNIDEVSIYIM